MQGGSKHINKEEEETTTAAEDTQETHPHVPSFYPQPPPLKTLTVEESRKVFDIDTIAEQQQQQQQQQQVEGRALATTEDSHGVRSSLVQLGSYWGSGWDAETARTKLAVPLGRREQQQSEASPILPLGRASGSRVSRILEGSLDAAAMQ
jgi:hypothetical protein